MRAKINIRRAGPALVAQSERQRSAKTYAKYLADRRAAAWLAEKKGAPLGYALLALAP